MPTEIPTFTTARLILRPLCLADASAIQAVFPQWDIVRYLTTVVPWPYPADGALTFLRDDALPAVAAGGTWYWSILPREQPDLLIGLLRLTAGADDHRGFWLAPDWRGRGLMMEAVTVTTDYWFDVLGYDVLRVSKAGGNIASRRISERQGMRLVAMEERDYICGRLPAEIWELTASEWRAHQS